MSSARRHSRRIAQERREAAKTFFSDHIRANPNTVSAEAAAEFLRDPRRPFDRKLQQAVDSTNLRAAMKAGQFQFSPQIKAAGLQIYKQHLAIRAWKKLKAYSAQRRAAQKAARRINRGR